MHDPHSVGRKRQESDFRDRASVIAGLLGLASAIALGALLYMGRDYTEQTEPGWWWNTLISCGLATGVFGIVSIVLGSGGGDRRADRRDAHPPAPQAVDTEARAQEPWGPPTEPVVRLVDHPPDGSAVRPVAHEVGRPEAEADRHAAFEPVGQEGRGSIPVVPPVDPRPRERPRPEPWSREPPSAAPTPPTPTEVPTVAKPGLPDDDPWMHELRGEHLGAGEATLWDPSPAAPTTAAPPPAPAPAPAPVEELSEYTAVYRRGDPGWWVEVEEVPGVKAEAGTLYEARERVLRALSERNGRPVDPHIVVDDVELPPPAAHAISRATAARHSLQAGAAVADAASVLVHHFELDLGDAAALLGVRKPLVEQALRTAIPARPRRRPDDDDHDEVAVEHVSPYDPSSSSSTYRAVSN